MGSKSFLYSGLNVALIAPIVLPWKPRIAQMKSFLFVVNLANLIAASMLSEPELHRKALCRLPGAMLTSFYKINAGASL